MGPMILGWVLIIIGVVAILFGVVGGIVTMFKGFQSSARSFAIGGIPTDFLKVLSEFLSNLIKAPVWLALIIIGVALIVWGGTMIHSPGAVLQ
jgi:hypothetical protein